MTRAHTLSVLLETPTPLPPCDSRAFHHARDSGGVCPFDGWQRCQAIPTALGAVYRVIPPTGDIHRDFPEPRENGGADTTARARGWPARFPVAQLPNARLSVALGGLLVSVVTDGSLHAYARAVFYVGLAAWAWEELVGGVNWVRRAIGAAGLGYVVGRVARVLGG